MAFFESDHSLVQIDLPAIRNNLKIIIQEASRSNCQLMPIVKSDAYGHGLVEVSKTLLKEKIWGLGIYEMEEAAILRKEGIKSRIFLLSGLLDGDAKRALSLGLTIGVVDWSELDHINEAAKALCKKAKVHLKIDTGMSRFGMSPNETVEAVKNRHKWQFIKIRGIYSHFSSSDDPLDPENQKQLTTFSDTLNCLKQYDFNPPWIHIANSSAIFHFPQAHFNLARPGIAIYGGCKNKDKYGLKPTLFFQSKIVHIKWIKKGAGVSYGHSFRAERDTKIGLIPIGYDNGYPRSLSNKSYVLVKGIKCAVLGTVCMKTIAIDLTGISDAKPGDKVTIIGEDNKEEISIVELADKAGTISYELLCLIGKLNRRKYIQEETCLE